MKREDTKVVDLAMRRRERSRRPVDPLDRRDRRVLLAMLSATLLVAALSLYRCSIGPVDPTARDQSPTSGSRSDLETIRD